MSALKLPRAIRLDPSDAFVFERAAEPGQWVVSGAFLFQDRPLEELSQKGRIALRSGLLGIEDFGWSTLAVVVSVSAEEVEAAQGLLARNFAQRFGAPEREAMEAARGEIAFAASIADHPDGTLIAVHRAQEDGAIRERFRTLERRPGGPQAVTAAGRVFQFVEEEEGPQESVDLKALLAHKRTP
jgi:hypothetical protein